jgi:hypothetical protein
MSTDEMVFISAKVVKLRFLSHLFAKCRALYVGEWMFYLLWGLEVHIVKVFSIITFLLFHNIF